MSANVVHSLWAAFLAVTAAGCTAVTGRAVRRKRTTRRRAALLFRPERLVRAMKSAEAAESGGRLRRALSSRGRTPVVLVVIAGAGIVGIVAGVTGCVLCLVAVCGVWRWKRKAERTAGEVSPEAVGRQLPLAADLLAACLAAGAGPREAAEAVGSALGGPVGERLAQAAAEVRLGAEPAMAWGRLGGLHGADGLARCLERAQATGVPAVEPMSRLAVRLRRAQGREAGIRARRAGVLATAPLGLCFLPAFLTVGLMPVLIGLASHLLKTR